VATRWVEMVLLDRVREDIMETKKLNPHLYNALKKYVADDIALLSVCVGANCKI